MVEGRGGMTIFYPDVSSYQAGISFAGCVIAVAKATEGTDYINPDYGPAKVRAANAGAYFCAYHFLHAGDGASQASYAYGAVGSEVPLMIDCEAEYNSNGTLASAPQVTDVVDFVNEYRALGGKTYLLYLPHWYWQGDMGSASLTPVIDLGMLLVSSDYTTYSDTGPGWAPYGGMTPVIWQYTSSATLNGVNNVDFNAYMGTLADFEAQVTTGAAPTDGGQAPAEPTLTEGDSGAAVQTLQTRLNVWGANLTVDGDFGPDTLAAVKAFQTEQKLTVDGIVGPLTWAALLADPGTYPAPTGLAVGSVTLAVTWDAVTVNGQAVASYTVEAIGLNGEVYVRETPTTNSVVLSGLVPGWTYNIQVSSNGGPGTPPNATLKVTV
jgi:peptidoglycan hydrolase-like protein with peptidoglycan-binding domain